MPPITAGAYLIEILFEVGPAKPMGMGGSVALDEIDLSAWMANQNVKLKPWEAKTIRQLSREYAAMLSQSSEANVPSPWVDPSIMTTERRNKIAKSMSDWGNIMKAKT